jgi:hypothetical protein
MSFTPTPKHQEIIASHLAKDSSLAEVLAELGISSIRRRQ